MRAFVFVAIATMGPCVPNSVVRTTPSRPTTIPSDCNVLASMQCDGQPCDPNLADNRSLARRQGDVSYYSDAFAGRRTASGDPYDPNALTAASRDWPFGAIVRITRTGSGQRVVVRVNDRGPWGRRRRILDLSRHAARCLEMERAGVVDVRAEVIDWGPNRAH